MHFLVGGYKKLLKMADFLQYFFLLLISGAGIQNFAEMADFFAIFFSF